MPYRFIEEDFSSIEPSESSRFRFVKEEPSKTRSLLSAAPKGFLKELRDQLVKTTQLAEHLPLVGEKLKEMGPLHAPEEEFLDEIEKILPTQEGFTEKSLERGGKIAPYAALGGGNLPAQALRSAVAGFLGQGAEDVGLPPWAQAIAELPAFATPGLGKIIIPKKGQEAVLENARKLGLSEEEIAPLIQSEKKQKFLGKLPPRRGRTKKLLDKSYKALGQVYDRLENLPEATAELSPQASQKVISSIENQMKEFPSELRKVLSGDIQDFLSQPITGSSLFNLTRDINYNLGKGHKQLGKLKEPIFDALEDISPELATDFRLTNKLYSNYSKIAEKLKPTLLSDLFGAGEAVRLLTGLSFGNFPMIAESIGEHATRNLARELLLNPRLQNLSSKMMQALNQNKIAVADRFLKEYIKEIEELNPEVGKELKTIDFSTQLHKGNK